MTATSAVPQMPQLLAPGRVWGTPDVGVPQHLSGLPRAVKGWVSWRSYGYGILDAGVPLSWVRRAFPAAPSVRFFPYRGMWRTLRSKKA